MINSVILKSLIDISKDGEWGKGEQFDKSVKMAVIRGTDFEKVRKGEIEDLPIRYIPKRIADRKILKPNDILLETAGGSKNRPTGRSLFINPSIVYKSELPLICASFSRFIRINPKRANSNYLFWQLQYLYHAGYLLQYHTQHTGVARFQYTVFSENEPLYLPPLPIQNKIASILSAYDDLIENNTRRIKILESMAQTIYQEWFVKFRFPGHEQVNMVESELGLIPEGWEVTKVTDAVLVNPKTQVPKQGQKPFVPMGSLSTDSMLINDIESRTSNSGAKFKNHDTLLARITPSLENGKTGYVQFLPSNDSVACGSTEFIVLRSKTLCSEYVYLLARSDDFRENAIKSMTGSSGRQRVQVGCFETFLIAHPDSNTIQKFSEIVSPLFRQIYVLSEKNINLHKTRDLLLPKLISGQIDVENLNIDTGELAA
ncbi:restriction endonuclease subunit S [Pleurocapsa sp. PCC 7319]|uniref:restriction endonuclease subunit S n=1 Tax=Pleurocapsa sp. PCC 7319 TaxID=118161 RepID=UPI00034C4BB3|nr:restriction endonuclease subunit S [Pleurocapsa sp. PCC 7319]